jgi:uncharacterized protein YndB with AHSA1/START domain
MATVPERLDLEFRLDCPPERAFRAFTEKIDLWWPKSHRKSADATMVFEANDGGRLLERGPAGERTIGDVTDWSPPTALSFDWRLGASDNPTHVEIRFEATSTGTNVKITHTPGAAADDDTWPKMVARFENGWTASIAALGDFLVKEDDGP